MVGWHEGIGRGSPALGTRVLALERATAGVAAGRSRSAPPAAQAERKSRAAQSSITAGGQGRATIAIFSAKGDALLRSICSPVRACLAFSGSLSTSCARVMAANSAASPPLSGCALVRSVLYARRTWGRGQRLVGGAAPAGATSGVRCRSARSVCARAQRRANAACACPCLQGPCHSGIDATAGMIEPVAAHLMRRGAPVQAQQRVKVVRGRLHFR